MTVQLVRKAYGFRTNHAPCLSLPRGYNLTPMALEDLPEIPIDLNEYRKWKERMEKYGQAGVTIHRPSEENQPQDSDRKPSPVKP